MTVPQLLVAGISLFLIGANVALLQEFWYGLARWWTAKIIAVTLLLTYMLLSVSMGNPALSRVVVGAVAGIIDVGAMLGVWRATHNAARNRQALVVYTPTKEGRKHE